MKIKKITFLIALLLGPIEGYTANETAYGVGATASGNGSTAYGVVATASGVNSTAVGLFSSASGDWSTASGTLSNAFVLSMVWC